MIRGIFTNPDDLGKNNVKARENICAIKHSLHIPGNTDSYRDFSSRMKKSETAFMKLFHDAT